MALAVYVAESSVGFSLCSVLAVGRREKCHYAFLFGLEVDDRDDPAKARFEKEMRLCEHHATMILPTSEQEQKSFPAVVRGYSHLDLKSNDRKNLKSYVCISDSMTLRWHTAEHPQKEAIKKD